MAPLANGESIVGIDFRPANGALYGLSRNGPNAQLYRIDTVTGALTSVGPPFPINGTSFGFDFNPTVDRIRVVSDTGLNLRLNPDTGAPTTDTALAYVTGDPNQAAMPRVTSSAYTNNVAGTLLSALFGIDPTLGILVRQGTGSVSPNGGGLSTVGSLGIAVSTVDGFDIAGAGAQTGLAVLSLTSTPTLSSVYSINLSTGAATALGSISSSELITGFAVDSPTLLGLTATGSLIRFHAMRPQTVLSTVAITGLAANDQLVGLDTRPSTGTVIAVGSSSRVYSLDVGTGVATQLSVSAPTTFTGTVFGVDVNPVTDRVRVISDADENVQLSASVGSLAATDSAITPAGTSVIEVAYAHNAVGLGTFTQLALDSTTDTLISFASPSAGTFSSVGPLTVNITGSAGFDIDLSNTGWAALQVGASLSSSLYSIDTSSGTAALVGPLTPGTRLVGLTVQLTPSPTAVVVAAGSLTRFPVSFPAQSTSVAISGLQASENIVGLDVRPATGALYAITDQARVYTLNTNTGAATVVSAMPFGSVSGGVAMDFNPTVDRIRVTTGFSANLRLNPDTGALAATDTGLAFAPGDLNSGSMAQVTSAAYSENFMGSTRTTLYGIDTQRTILVRIGGPFGAPSPNGGQTFTLASLTCSGVTGFDIDATGTAYVARGTLGEIAVLNLATGQCRATGSLTGLTPQAFAVLP